MLNAKVSGEKIKRGVKSANLNTYWWAFRLPGICAVSTSCRLWAH